MEMIIAAERESQAKNYKTLIDNLTESMRYQISIITNVKLAPLTQDEEAVEEQKRNIRMNQKDEKNDKFFYKLNGSLNEINSKLQTMMFKKKNMMVNEKEFKKVT